METTEKKTQLLRACEGTSDFKVLLEATYTILTSDPNDKRAWFYHARGHFFHKQSKSRWKDSHYTFEFCRRCMHVALDTALKIDPGFMDAWYLKGCGYMDWGEYDDAVDCFDIIIKLDPGNKHAWYTKFLVLLLCDKFEEAQDCWDCILAFDGDFSRYIDGIKNLLVEKKKTRYLLMCLDHACPVETKDPNRWLQRAKVLYSIQYTTSALGAVNKAIALDPTNKEAFVYKAHILKDAFDDEYTDRDIEECLARVIEMDENNINALYWLGRYLQKNNNPAALEYYDRVLDNAPFHECALKAKMIFLREWHRDEEAEECEKVRGKLYHKWFIEPKLVARGAFSWRSAYF